VHAGGSATRISNGPESDGPGSHNEANVSSPRGGKGASGRAAHKGKGNAASCSRSSFPVSDNLGTREEPINIDDAPLPPDASYLFVEGDKFQHIKEVRKSGQASNKIAASSKEQHYPGAITNYFPRKAPGAAGDNKASAPAGERSQDSSSEATDVESTSGGDKGNDRMSKKGRDLRYFDRQANQLAAKRREARRAAGGDTDSSGPLELQGATAPRKKPNLYLSSDENPEPQPKTTMAPSSSSSDGMKTPPPPGGLRERSPMSTVPMVSCLHIRKHIPFWTSS
jgi:hypothetical protein